MWKKFTQPTKTVISIAVGFSALFFVDHFEFTGAEEAIGQVARDYFNILVAPIIKPENNSVVVLIDDFFLNETENDWPLSKSSLANLIDAVTERHPKALMIGMLLMNRHSDEKEKEQIKYLHDAIYNDDNVPVFLSAIEEGKGKIIRDINPMYNISENSNVSLVSVKSNSYHNRHIKVDHMDLNKILPLENYPNGGTPVYRCGEKYGENSLLMPAHMRIYFDINICNKIKEIDLYDYVRPMDVFWFAGPTDYKKMVKPGNYTEDFDRSFSKGDDSDRRITCQKPWYQNGSIFNVAKAIISDFNITKSLISNKTEYFQKVCPFIPIVRASDILFQNHEMLDDILRDKVVFLGVSITGVSDEIAPPNSIRVPSVMIHAMAYENLMYFGKRYISSESVYFTNRGRSIINGNTIGFINTTVIVFFVTTFVIIISIFRKKIEQLLRLNLLAGVIINLNDYLGSKFPILYDGRNYDQNKITDETSEYVIDFFIMIISFILSIIISFVSFFALRITPSNWIYFSISISVIYLWVQKNTKAKSGE